MSYLYKKAETIQETAAKLEAREAKLGKRKYTDSERAGREFTKADILSMYGSSSEAIRRFGLNLNEEPIDTGDDVSREEQEKMNVEVEKAYSQNII